MQALPQLPDSAFAPRPLGDRDFFALLHASSEPIVVASHFAGWAEPWLALGPDAWRELAREFGERVRLVSLETGANRETARRFGLEILPEVLVLAEGAIVARFSGRVSSAAIGVALRAALERSRALETAREELAALESARELASPVRSVLRSRANGPHEPAFERDAALVRAG